MYTLKDLLDELQLRSGEHKVLQAICRDRSLSYRRIEKHLKDVGIEYDRKLKRHIIKDGFSPTLEKDLAAAFPSAQRADTPADPQPQDSDSMALITQDLLYDMLAELKQINEKMPAMQQTAAALDLDSQPMELHAARLFEIEKLDKTRKTISIARSAAGWLDAYAAKHKVNIGDIVSYCVLEMIKKIDKND